MGNALYLNLPSTAGSLETYIDAVNRIPLLTESEEQAFARKFREEEDIESARKLVLAHLRFVVKVARGYAGYGLAQGDLIQEGNVGLMKAVKRFDPDVGVRLVSFAVHWIKAEIHEFILRNWRIVKVATTKAQRKLFFNLRSAKKSLGWMGTEETAQLAQSLDVDTRDVETMEARLSAQDIAFDTSPDQDNDSFVPAAYLEDLRIGPAEACEQAQTEAIKLAELDTAMGELDERSRDIVVSRWLSEPKATLHTLAERYGVSAERIRQIEKNAFNKMRELMPEFAALVE